MTIWGIFSVSFTLLCLLQWFGSNLRRFGKLLLCLLPVSRSTLLPCGAPSQCPLSPVACLLTQLRRAIRTARAKLSVVLSAVQARKDVQNECAKRWVAYSCLLALSGQFSACEATEFEGITRPFFFFSFLNSCCCSTPKTLLQLPFCANRTRTFFFFSLVTQGVFVSDTRQV